MFVMTFHLSKITTFGIFPCFPVPLKPFLILLSRLLFVFSFPHSSLQVTNGSAAQAAGPGHEYI